MRLLKGSTLPRAERRRIIKRCRNLFAKLCKIKRSNSTSPSTAKQWFAHRDEFEDALADLQQFAPVSRRFFDSFLREGPTASAGYGALPPQCWYDVVDQWEKQGNEVFTKLLKALPKRKDGLKQHPFRLDWKGKSSPLEPIPWRLLQIMWNKQSCSEAKVCLHVWGDGWKPDSTVKPALHKANVALFDVGITWDLYRKAGKFHKSS
jgi:hypothetical protein